MVALAPAVWNSFIFNSDPERYQKASLRWSAAVACRFMGSVTNGGMNAFLTNSHDLDSDEVVEALSAIGADLAAAQLRSVLRSIGRRLPACSQEDRWAALESCWTDELEALDNFPAETEAELMAALEAHVQADNAFYLTLCEAKQGT